MLAEEARRDAYAHRKKDGGNFGSTKLLLSCSVAPWDDANARKPFLGADGSTRSVPKTL